MKVKGQFYIMMAVAILITSNPAQVSPYCKIIQGRLVTKIWGTDVSKLIKPPPPLPPQRAAPLGHEKYDPGPYMYEGWGKSTEPSKS